MKRDLVDRASDIVFWPWDAAVGRGYLVGIPMMLLGVVWILPMVVVLLGPALFIEISRDMLADLQKPRQEKS